VDETDDTSPEAKRVMLDLMRRASIEDRIRLAFSLTDMVRTMANAELRRTHPDANESEMRRLMARRYLDPELARAVIAKLDQRGQ